MGGGEEVPRYADANPDVPAPEGFENATGYGRVGTGPRYTMYGFDEKEVQTYPENIHPLDKMRWFNYSKWSDDLPNYPFVSSSIANQRRIWQDMDVDRMLDYTPPHDIHASELPDYHYFPRIQDELATPRTGLAAITTFGGHKSPHHQPQSYIPRFLRTGIPKTPIQEQNWYLPLNNDGRFNWRGNIDKNGYTASYFSSRGWDRRFEVNVRRQPLLTEWLGLTHFANEPSLFRLNELNLLSRCARMVKGSSLSWFWIVFVFYSGFLVSASLGDTNFRRMSWNHEPSNFDIAYMTNVRDIGGFHGII